MPAPPPDDHPFDPELYAELRRLAGVWMHDERPGHTLRATELVGEAWLRLEGSGRAPAWEDRGHFIAVAARTMRRVLVDHARKRAAEKRGGQWQRLTLGAADDVAMDDPARFLALDDALERLAALDPRAAQVVELRFFGGLTMEEAAEQLGVSRRTAQGDWAMARAWLEGELSTGS